MLQKRGLVGLGIALSAFVSREASAVEPEITSDTTAQFYEVRSPTGETVLARRRLTTTLGVAAYDLIDAPAGNPNAPTLSFRARMRYDADYGSAGAEADSTNFGRFVPGFQRGPVDLMYAYVEGRKFFKGWLGFKLGRQYVTDALGWWSFDGGLVRVTTPFFVALEGYGGLEVRGGMPLSTPRWEATGMWRGDRSGYDASLYSAFQPNNVAPAYGFALESTGVNWMHGRLTYRRVNNTGSSNVSEFANGLTTPVVYNGTRVSQERIGYALDASAAKIGGIKAGFAYDLYNTRFANIFGSIDAYPSQKLTLSADYDYYQPTFDADSIWNFFQAAPMNDIGTRANYDVTDSLSIAAGGHVRIFRQQTEADAVTSPTSPNGLANGNYYAQSAADLAGGGNLAGRYRVGVGSVALRGNADTGSTGNRYGADINGERVFETRYVFSGRASLWQWNDRLRPDRDAISVGYVAGVGYRFSPRSQTMFEFEHNINRLAGQRFRAMLWLTLAVTK